jgi:uncharacterized membrane protein YukC
MSDTDTVNLANTTPQSAASNTTGGADPAKKSLVYYFTFGVIIICVLYILYHAYHKFVCNSKESFIKGNEQERTDTVVDFNLREAVKELENLQNSILSKVSNLMS